MTTLAEPQGCLPKNTKGEPLQVTEKLLGLFVFVSYLVGVFFPVVVLSFELFFLIETVQDRTTVPTTE